MALRQKAKSIAKRLNVLVTARSLRRFCCRSEQRARGRKVSGKRRGKREEDGTSRVGTRLGTRYARVAGECLTKASMRRRGERTM